MRHITNKPKTAVVLGLTPPPITTHDAVAGQAVTYQLRDLMVPYGTDKRALCRGYRAAATHFKTSNICRRRNSVIVFKTAC